ncbi:hypothetical protein A3753_12500 [Sulfitobacter sp. HI0082]|nr:hypothetical protein A3753_12500 [Sulfitobacter sp. HI0082]|tara:strand:- start:1835 stop:2239 length:405 start_codon:yes stop_codon:yes gene_type:complete
MFMNKLRARREQAAARRKIPMYRPTVPHIKGNQSLMLVITFAAVVLGALNISAVRTESASAEGQGTDYAQAAPSSKGERGGRPPQEAVEACENAKPQSACEFPSREGDAVQGNCMSPKADVPLACAPANMPKKG